MNRHAWRSDCLPNFRESDSRECQVTHHKNHQRSARYTAAIVDGGNPWFPASDACRVLGMNYEKNGSGYYLDHIADKHKRGLTSVLPRTPTSELPPHTTMLSEAGHPAAARRIKGRMGAEAGRGGVGATNFPTPTPAVAGGGVACRSVGPNPKSTSTTHNRGNSSCGFLNVIAMSGRDHNAACENGSKPAITGVEIAPRARPDFGSRISTDVEISIRRRGWCRTHITRQAIDGHSAT